MVVEDLCLLVSGAISFIMLVVLFDLMERIASKVPTTGHPLVVMAEGATMP